MDCRLRARHKLLFGFFLFSLAKPVKVFSMLSSQKHNSQSKATRDLMLFFLESILTYISYKLQEETLGHRLVFKTFSFKWNKKYLNWISCMTIWNQVCWFIGFITCLSCILVHKWWLKPFWCTAKVGIDGEKKRKEKRLWLGVFTDLAAWPCPTFFPRSSFSFAQEVSYWLFSVVAMLSLLLSDSMRAFLLVASSVKALTCKRWSEAKDKRKTKTRRSLYLSRVERLILFFVNPSNEINGDACYSTPVTLCSPFSPARPPARDNFSPSPAGTSASSLSLPPAVFSCSHPALHGWSWWHE